MKTSNRRKEKNIHCGFLSCCNFFGEYRAVFCRAAVSREFVLEKKGTKFLERKLIPEKACND